MVNLKILCNSLEKVGVNTTYENSSTIVINQITIIIKNEVASFGVCKIKLKNTFDFLCQIENEGVIIFAKGLKSEIVKLYEVELYKNI